MKKLFILLFTLLSVKGYSQFPINSTNGTPTTTVLTRGISAADSGYWYRTAFADTTALNRGSIDQIPGVLARTSDNSLWLRNNSATGWIQLFINSPTADTLVWKLSGNTIGGRVATPVFGTLDGHDINFITNGSTRLSLPSGGLARNSAATTKYLTFDTITKQMYYNDALNWYNTDGTFTGNRLALNTFGTVLIQNVGINRNFTSSIKAAAASTDSSMVRVRRSGPLNIAELTAVEGNENWAIRTGIHAIDLVFQDATNGKNVIHEITADSMRSRVWNTISGELSETLVSPATIYTKPHLGNYIIDTINYTLSTTRKKIMLRDTATGLVQNIDPALLVTATPTLQQVLTAGSTLTTSNTVNGGQQELEFSNNLEFRVVAGVVELAGNSGGDEHRFLLGSNETVIEPGFGNLRIDTLKNRTNQNALIGWDSTGADRGQVGYVTIGSGLSLASGVLNTSGTVPTPISSLTAATGTNSIENGNFEQTWEWDALAAIGLRLQSSATTAASNNQVLLYGQLSGANANSNQTTRTVQFENVHTGTGSVNTAGYFRATGGATNYSLDLTGAVRHNGTSSGAITIQPAAAAGTYTLTLPTTDGNASEFLQTDGSGVLTWAAASGGVTTLAAIGSSPNANGATISGSTLNLEPASASFGGVVTTGTQTMAGAKTFTGAFRASSGSVALGDGTPTIYVGGIHTTEIIATGTNTPLTVIGGSGLIEYWSNSTPTYAAMIGLGTNGAVSANIQFSTYNSGTSWQVRHEILNSDGSFIFNTNSNDQDVQIKGDNDANLFYANGGTDKIGIGTASPGAWLQIKAGTATATQAPLKFTTGTLNTTPEVGSKEYNNAHYETNNAINRYALGGPIKDFIATVDNGTTVETDLFTYTTKASTLAADGEKLVFELSGTFNDLTATAQLQFYYGGNNVGNTGALTVSATGGWSARVIVIRTGASTARSYVTVTTPGASTALYTTQTDITGLTFTNTQILKCTGTAAGASGGTGDISAKLGFIEWKGSANN